jgi:hypothetical protein
VSDLPVGLLLEHVLLHQRQRMWLMRGGAQHSLRNVRLHQNQTFGEQWIGRGGPVNWPARSPDLNPLEFWLRGHVEALVYSARINGLEVLQHRVENACQESRVKPGIFYRASASVRRRAASCVETHGKHREHLLQRSLEHRPYVSKHGFWIYTDWIFC